MSGDQPDARVELVPNDVRQRLALALDFDDLVAALRVARALRPWFGVAKVGFELYSAVGPDAVSTMTNLGYSVFADVKLHDIPTTVHRAARIFGALGATYLNLHTAGGEAMVRAGVEGFTDGARAAGLPDPVAVGTTVLTSEPEATVELLRARVDVAVAAGCGGVVCAAPDLPLVRQVAPQLQTIVPGIRPEGTAVDDQSRVATPTEAVRAGADLLVIGRAVTRSDDPVAAADAVCREVLAAVSESAR
jgi:orotidine-5'-phosphate decarboxylase